MHPRSKHWHLIDYVIVRRTDRQDVKVTKTMCGADCWTDHRLVVSKLNLRIQPARRPQGKKAPKRLDVSKLNKDSMRQDFLRFLITIIIVFSAHKYFIDFLKKMWHVTYQNNP